MLFLFLAVYSFLGWIAEVLYVLVRERSLQNRGFLTGPFVPIYGFGAIALILLVLPYIDNPFVVFIASVLITSILEFVTHLVLDKLFHIKLWDYSNRRFNLQGRICLENSLLFGMLGLLLIYVLHPAVVRLLVAIPHDAAIALAWTLIGILIVDAANSIRSLAKLRPVLDGVSGTLAQTHDRIEQGVIHLEDTIGQRRSATDAAHLATLDRLVKAFPHAKSSKAPSGHPQSQPRNADLD
jgi:uncharacterized membrane protein